MSRVGFPGVPEANMAEVATAIGWALGAFAALQWQRARLLGVLKERRP